MICRCKNGNAFVPFLKMHDYEKDDHLHLVFSEHRRVCIGAVK
jgi:hypothetical protein